MCQACPTINKTSRERRLLTKRDFSPEEERAFDWLLRQYQDALTGPEREIREFVEQASADELSSLTSIRSELEPRIGRYTADFEAVFREGGERGAQAGRALAARRSQLSINFNLIPERTLAEIDDWVDTAAGSTMDTITEDATRWLRGAHEDGLGIDDIADQLNTELFEGRLEDSVAENAALTATNSTANAGSHSAHEDADAVVAEEWLAELDGREREDHAEADGQVVAVGGSFEVGGSYLEHPGDPSAPIGQIARCRCVAIPRFADELTADQLDAIESGDRIWIR